MRVCWRALSLAALAVNLHACGSIALREAMNRVQESYQTLASEIEAGSNFAVRDAARNLQVALESPAVTRSPLHADSVEFRKLLQEAIRSAEEVREAARRFDQKALANMRTEVSARCEACHKKFRIP